MAKTRSVPRIRQFINIILVIVLLFNIAGNALPIPVPLRLALSVCFPISLLIQIFTQKPEIPEKEKEMSADVEKTKAYYDALSDDSLSGCCNSASFRRNVKKAFPGLAEWLAERGVDIEKPLEVIRNESDTGDETQEATAQYVVIGTCPDHAAYRIKGIHVEVTDDHPPTGVQEGHFVLMARLPGMPVSG